MAEFPDPTSKCGEVGALTVVGDIMFRGISWTYSLRWSVLRATAFWPLRFFQRLGFNMAYQNLDELRSLYAFRWSVVHLDGSRRGILIFETVFVGDWEQYLRLLVENTAPGISLHAIGARAWPGTSNFPLFMSFLGERHRPASVVYAANRYASPIEARAALAGVPQSARQRGRWYGAIVRVLRGRRTQLEGALLAWDTAASSPFAVPGVQHGRAVLFDHEDDTYLLISVVATSAAMSGHRESVAQGDALDQQIVRSLLGDGRVAAWVPVLEQCVGSPRDEEQITAALMATRFGHRARTAIRWVDWPWDFSPDYLGSRLDAMAATPGPSRRPPIDPPGQAQRPGLAGSFPTNADRS